MTARARSRRRSTPVDVIAEDLARDEIVVSPMRGGRGDWYRNTLAGGLVEASLRGDPLAEVARAIPMLALRRVRP